MFVIEYPLVTVDSFKIWTQIHERTCEYLYGTMAAAAVVIIIIVIHLSDVKCSFFFSFFLCVCVCYVITHIQVNLYL